MKKLLFISLILLIGFNGTASPAHGEEDAVTTLLQSDVPIKEKDITVVNGFLPVQGIQRDGSEFYPATGSGDSAVLIERDEAGNVTKIIRYETGV